MSPFHDLFSSAEFWSALILALLGGGGIGGLVGAWSNSRKTEADIDGIRRRGRQGREDSHGKHHRPVA